MFILATLSRHSRRMGLFQRDIWWVHDAAWLLSIRSIYAWVAGWLLPAISELFLDGAYAWYYLANPFGLVGALVASAQAGDPRSTISCIEYTPVLV